jgi:hypothetical protein
VHEVYPLQFWHTGGHRMRGCLRRRASNGAERLYLCVRSALPIAALRAGVDGVAPHARSARSLGIEWQWTASTPLPRWHGRLAHTESLSRRETHLDCEPEECGPMPQQVAVGLANRDGWRSTIQVSLAIRRLVEDPISPDDGARPRRIAALTPVCRDLGAARELAEDAARYLGIGIVKRVERGSHDVSFPLRGIDGDV